MKGIENSDLMNFLISEVLKHSSDKLPATTLGTHGLCMVFGFLFLLFLFRSCLERLALRLESF